MKKVDTLNLYTADDNIHYNDDSKSEKEWFYNQHDVITWFSAKYLVMSINFNLTHWLSIKEP